MFFHLGAGRSSLLFLWRLSYRWKIPFEHICLFRAMYSSISVCLSKSVSESQQKWIDPSYITTQFSISTNCIIYQLYHTSNASFGIWSSFLLELISWSIAVRSLLECPGPLWFRNPIYSDHFKAVQRSSQILSLMKKLIERKLPFSRISKPYVRLNSWSLVKLVHY